MKTITIKQPWATLIIEGYKKYEFRSWKTKYRGDILIHAGKGIDKEAVQKLKKYLPEKLPSEQIIGKVTITDCIPITEEFKQELTKQNKDLYTEKTTSTNYGWKIENVKKFKNPIEAKGKLSLWEYNIEQ